MKFEETTLGDFYDEFIVRCPKCGTGGNVLLEVIDRRRKGRFGCGNCGYSTKQRAIERTPGVAIDPFLGLELMLQTQCNGKPVWAYNWRHLAFLEELTQTRLRRTTTLRHSSYVLTRRLPEWMLLAKNRRDLLRAVTRIRKANR